MLHNKDTGYLIDGVNEATACMDMGSVSMQDLFVATYNMMPLEFIIQANVELFSRFYDGDKITNQLAVAGFNLWNSLADDPDIERLMDTHRSTMVKMVEALDAFRLREDAYALSRED